MLGIIIIIDILQLRRRYDRYISALSRSSIPGKFSDSHHSVQNKTREVPEGPQTLCSRKAINSGDFSNSPFSLQTCPLTGQHPEREGRGGVITDSKRGSKEQTSPRWQRLLRTCVIHMSTPANYRVGNRKVGWEWRGGQPAPSCLFLLSAH